MVLEDATKTTDQQGVLRRVPLPRKRHSSEMQKETPKKSKAVLTDGDGPTTIKGKRFILLKPKTRQERCGLISKCETYWGKSMAEVITKSVWPRARDKITQLEPRDWPTSLLRKMERLADETLKRPELAAAAIQQAIDERSTWYSNETWLVFIEDAEAAIQRVLTGKVFAPTEEGARIDSPLTDAGIHRPETTTVSTDARASLMEDERDESGHDSSDEDLYSATPRPQQRPVEMPSLSRAAAVKPRRAASDIEIVDLTMEDPADQDVKQPLAFYNESIPFPNARGVISPGSKRASLLKIMTTSRDMSKHTIPEILKIVAEARDWKFKAERAAEGRQIDEFANVSLDDVRDVYNHAHDVQIWAWDEIEKKRSKQLT